MAGKGDSNASGANEAGQAANQAANQAGKAAKKGAEAGVAVGKLVASGGTDVSSWIKLIKILGPILLAIMIAIGVGFIAIVSAILGGQAASASTCTTGGPTSIAVLATNGPVNVGSTYTYPSSPPSTGTITAEKMGNAQAIVRAALNRNPPAPDKAIVIALATALVESQFINSNVATDLDSLGLFQQRPSQGWGTPEQIMDPNYSTNIFLDRLLAINGWDTAMTPGTAAQKVQRSAYPSRYDAVIPTAAGLAQSILAAFQTAGTGTPNTTPGATPPATSKTYILGDSITVMSKDQYTQLFSSKGITATISAVVGRSWTTPGSGTSVGTTGTGRSAAETDQQAIKDAGSVIIALGTNGGLAANPVDEIISTIRSYNSTAPIYWVNIAGTASGVKPNVVAFNSKLNEQDTAGKINVADWASTVNPGGDGTQDPNGLLSDGIHPTSTGVTKLMEVVGSTFDSMQGTNANGCGNTTGNGGDSSQCPPDTFFNSTTFRSTGSAHDLCVKSVEQARSPEAGKAIMWAFNHVGIPYGRPDGVCSTNTTRTGPDHYDCSGFTTSAYSQTGTNVGGNPTTSTMQSNWPQAYQVTADQARPGDLLLPSSGHVVMVLADNMIIHTNKCGDVSHVRTKYNGSFMHYYAIRTPAAAAP